MTRKSYAFIKIICGAPWISQVQRTVFPSVYLRAQPCHVTEFFTREDSSKCLQYFSLQSVLGFDAISMQLNKVNSLKFNRPIKLKS